MIKPNVLDSIHQNSRTQQTLTLYIDIYCALLIKSPVAAYLCQLSIPNVLTTNEKTLNEEYHGFVKFNLGPNVKVKSNIVNLNI